MADLRQVEVVFKVGASAENEKKPSEKIKKGTKNKVQTLQKEDKWYDNLYIQQAWSYVKAEVSSVAHYEMNKWYALRDDYIGQRNMNVALNVISRAKDIATTIYAGFKTGGTVGAGIAAVSSVYMLVWDIIQNEDRQNIMLRQMDAQLDYQRQRAGFSLTSGRVGENR